MEEKSEIIDIRNLYYYESDNIFTGSWGDFNYKIIPDLKEKTLSTSIWYGRICSDIAEIISEGKFSLTQEGFDEMIKWLNTEYQNFTDRKNADA